MSNETVKVAVRVRPFNQREKDRNAKLIIKMVGKTTTIIDPNNTENEKNFNFDYSYWSHDGFKYDINNMLVPNNPSSNYSSQQMVFNDLGQGVLDNAMKGYNCSLFAYGQTGSGKSYSMIGFDNNIGIVPITCNELFKTIKSKSSDSEKYSVSLSMLEIYNERIRDLLTSTLGSKESLPVKENKNNGFYVQNLIKIPVDSYEQVEKRMNQGTSNRTIAATQMNATSSRAHTVITIEFNQVIKSGESTNTKTSVIQLIDLAGSERADSTGATGDRLIEGASINKSLSALGNVISALTQSKKNGHIPYRDSVLTKLLKNALGGNSKTVMIAALSPADINYEETISTLRYANRVKNIKNVAVINENPLKILIRELKEENERLKMALNGQLPKDVNTKGMTEEEILILRKEIEDELRNDILSKSDLIDLNDSKNWEAKVKAANSTYNDKHETETKKKLFPHLTNLNEDPQLNNALCYFIEHSNTYVGKTTNVTNKAASYITIFGPGVQKNHAFITYNASQRIVSIKPSSENAIVRVNGQKISRENTTNLNDQDRLVIGSSNLYLMNNPFIRCTQSVEWTWNDAQCEIAGAEGFDIEDMSVLESEIIEILPMVHEVNAISQEMKKDKKFDVLIIPEQAQDIPFKTNARPKVVVKMTSLINNNTWILEKSHFINRRYIIQEFYERFLDGEDISDVPYKQDPFWEPSSDILVGHSHVFLQNLMYNIGLEHSVSVVDYKGKQEGTIKLKIEPCNKAGELLDSQEYLNDEFMELLKKPYFVKISIDHLTLLKTRFIHGCNVKFSVYQQSLDFETKTIKNTLEADFNFTKIIEWSCINMDHLDYFREGMITLRVYGIQKDIKQHGSSKQQSLKQNQLQFTSEVETNKMKIENQLNTAINNQQKRKIERLKQLCMEWDKKPKEEQLFEPFFRSVSAITFSNGNKFKIIAKVIGKTSLFGKQIKNKAMIIKRMGQEIGKAKNTLTHNENDRNGSEICSLM